MVIKFSRKFTKQYNKADESIKSAFNKRLKLFFHNQSHTLLYNHPLRGKLAGYRSISITGDWRAIYSESEKKRSKIIIFEMLGTHGQLYK